MCAEEVLSAIIKDGKYLLSLSSYCPLLLGP